MTLPQSNAPNASPGSTLPPVPPHRRPACGRPMVAICHQGRARRPRRGEAANRDRRALAATSDHRRRRFLCLPSSDQSVCNRPPFSSVAVHMPGTRRSFDKHVGSCENRVRAEAHRRCAGVPSGVRRPAARRPPRQGSRSSLAAASSVVTRRLRCHPVASRLVACAAATASAAPPFQGMIYSDPVSDHGVWSPALWFCCSTGSSCRTHRRVCKPGDATRSLCGHRCMHEEPTGRVAPCSQWAPCSCHDIESGGPHSQRLHSHQRV